MNALRFVVTIIRWPSFITALVLLVWAFNTPTDGPYMVLAFTGIGAFLVFLLSLPIAERKPARLAKKWDVIEHATGPELSRLDRLDGVGNRTPKEQK